MTLFRTFNITALFLLLPLLTTAAFAATSTAKNSSSHHASTHKTSAKSSKHFTKVTKTSSKSRGQRNIGEERTREIQSALIREHYLTGEPSGVWDQDSKQAMMRFQQANGWQSKTVPDSRALIKLGLGPDHKDLLNPDSAAVASPHELGADHEALPGGSSQF
jgi:peptidoglycan hydrolase-like protein with peptidoglycan-binding domain